MRKHLVILALPLFFSCVSQAEYDKLTSDYEELQEEATDLNLRLEAQSASIAYYQKEIRTLKDEKRKEELRQSNIRYVSDEEARGYIKDYYEFYNSNFVYRNAKLRRVADNKFTVSLEECSKRFRDNEFHWSSFVYDLTVNNDQTYVFGRGF